MGVVNGPQRWGWKGVLEESLPIILASLAAGDEWRTALLPIQRLLRTLIQINALSLSRQHNPPRSGAGEFNHDADRYDFERLRLLGARSISDPLQHIRLGALTANRASRKESYYALGLHEPVRML